MIKTDEEFFGYVDSYCSKEDIKKLYSEMKLGDVKDYIANCVNVRIYGVNDKEGEPFVATIVYPAMMNSILRFFRVLPEIGSKVICRCSPYFKHVFVIGYLPPPFFDGSFFEKLKIKFDGLKPGHFVFKFTTFFMYINDNEGNIYIGDIYGSEVCSRFYMKLNYDTYECFVKSLVKFIVNDFIIDGNLEVKGDVEMKKGLIVANDAIINGISFINHVHNVGTGQTSPPIKF